MAFISFKRTAIAMRRAAAMRNCYSDFRVCVYDFPGLFSTNKNAYVWLMLLSDLFQRMDMWRERITGYF